uniref:Uncharacterized protein n=1 Tax=Cacopsylla melanoneura TaxID=428564 RepID=A0A8D8RI78_9HEMI
MINLCPVMHHWAVNRLRLPYMWYTWARVQGVWVVVGVRPTAELPTGRERRVSPRLLLVTPGSIIRSGNVASLVHTSCPRPVWSKPTPHLPYPQVASSVRKRMISHWMMSSIQTTTVKQRATMRTSPPTKTQAVITRGWAVQAVWAVVRRRVPRRSASSGSTMCSRRDRRGNDSY